MVTQCSNKEVASINSITHPNNRVFPESLNHSTAKKIPIKIILNDDEELLSSHGNSSETNEPSIDARLLKLKESNTGSKTVYIFKILKSRKKEKKYLRKKYNNIVSRVHNMDCLLKKIKA
jgi:hypothetical protein